MEACVHMQTCLSESLLLHTQIMDINVESNQTFDHVASLNTSESVLI